MKLTPLAIPEVVLVEVPVHGDRRGRFRELWRHDRYAQLIPQPFLQDNISVSHRGTLRGLHFQHPHGQGKLVAVLSGAAWDVAVDVRTGSPTFGRWVAAELTGENGCHLWIPPGFAHGFQALRDETVFVYKCTETWRPECERTVHWADPDLAVDWPFPAEAVVSERDAAAPRLAAMAPGTLPAFA